MCLNLLALNLIISGETEGEIRVIRGGLMTRLINIKFYYSENNINRQILGAVRGEGGTERRSLVLRHCLHA